MMTRIGEKVTSRGPRYCEQSSWKKDDSPPQECPVEPVLLEERALAAAYPTAVLVFEDFRNLHLPSLRVKYRALVAGERTGEPLEISESAEKRDIGRPMLSLLIRSGLGGGGIEELDPVGTGPESCSWTRTCPAS